MAEELFEALFALDEIEAAALGGSRAGSHFDEKSDYDVYVYLRRPVPEELRREILSRFCSVMEIGNHFWETEDNCTLKNGIDIDIIYRKLDDFTEDVASVVERYQAHNGYTTCMWHNLKTCRILCDKEGRLAAAKARFDVPYPQELKAHILENNYRLLHGSLPSYDAQILKMVHRRDLAGINHRMAAFLESYFDLLFALNEQTHPGEKRMKEYCLKCCRVLPARFEENLEALLIGMYEEEAVVAANLNAVLEELEKILP